MSGDIDQTIRLLLGTEITENEKYCIPNDLSEKYDRIGAAMDLGESNSTEPKVLQALSHSCKTDHEIDVRIASLAALAKLDQKIASEIALSFLEDRDEAVRKLASEVIANAHS